MLRSYIVSSVTTRLAQHTRLDDLANRQQVSANEREELGSGPPPGPHASKLDHVMAMVDTNDRRSLSYGNHYRDHHL
jgi:hypothetical protein